MRVTAVIPTYNYGQFVVAAVESALAQTGVEMEVVVVDDGSTDDTAERLQPYTDRIRYIRQPNGGLSAARNTGIGAASGEWIALLDSDDIWHPDKTRVQLSAALREVPAAGCIGSPSSPAITLPLDECPVVRHLNISSMLLKTKFGPSGALVRRDCFDEVGGFDLALGPAADRDMWLRLAVRYDVVQVRSPCWFYRTHPGQMSLDAEKMYKDYRRVLDKFFRENPGQSRLRASAYAFLYMDTAVCYRESRDRRKALALALQSLYTYPRPFQDEIMRFWRLKFIGATILSRFVINAPLLA